MTRRRKIVPAHPSELTECWMDGNGLRYTPPWRTKLYRWWMHQRGFERLVDWSTREGTGYMWVKRNA